MPRFELVSPFQPTGDQPNAIRELVAGLERGDRAQTLLGATGTGKTFTISNVIEQTQRPALIIAPNKTLAAQLFSELKELFPHNAVEFFVSYYNHYRPEAYIPSTDTFIEKDASINEAIDRMRHAATHSLLTRNDVIIVASVSCIFGLGNARAYLDMKRVITCGDIVERDDLLRDLIKIQYHRSGTDFERGTFRVRGDTIEIFPPYEEERAVRIQLFGDEVESIQEIDPRRGRVLADLEKISLFPASHHIMTDERREAGIRSIQAEMKTHLALLRENERFAEAQRLEQRTIQDLEMLITMGFCNGIENYSQPLSGRDPGEPPPCLIDYFPKNFLLIVDESHVSLPQIRGMYRGDRSRKQTLVEYGFRLPSALDNRPLNFDEFSSLIGQAIFASATPGEMEMEACEGVIVEQIIRPTGLLDPVVEVKPATNQVDDVLEEIRKVIEKNGRILITTLTKRMSEDLTEYLTDLGIKTRYLHSDINTLDRHAILRDLRLGVFDVLIGINLLREGLDLPEVCLVAILDADREGFLRSKRSLIQTIGRAARNSEGRVILYADKETDSIRYALEETNRRRKIQHAYNIAHDITPKSINKPIRNLNEHVPGGIEEFKEESHDDDTLNAAQAPERIATLSFEMKIAARELDFERAAALRDRLNLLKIRFA